MDASSTAMVLMSTAPGTGVGAAEDGNSVFPGLGSRLAPAVGLFQLGYGLQPCLTGADSFGHSMALACWL